MSKRLVLFTKIVLDVMFYIGILITVSIPFLFKYLGTVYTSFKDYYIWQCAIFLIMGILALVIVYELRKMFKTVLRDDAFVMENAYSLKRIGKCSFVIAFFLLVRVFLSLTPAGIVTMIVFAIAGLFSIVLCQVFQKAVQYKLENDLTI